MKVILTGASGMVGEGVLRACLKNPEIEKILVVGRRPCGYSGDKLTETLIPDFFDMSSVERQMEGYDACFFCLGISSVGLDPDAYYRTTYDLTMLFARTFAAQNPGGVFCYISGAGTDTSEKGGSRWARVKGKTENDLIKTPGLQAYALRPAFMKPEKGSLHVNRYYWAFAWAYLPGKLLSPGFFITLDQLTRAMIALARNGSGKRVLGGRDIVALAGKKQ